MWSNDSRVSRQHNAALAREFSAAGIAIFPAHLSRRADGRWNKIPCIAGWRTGATYDLEQIERWSRQCPDSVAGIELSKSNLIVIDCDRHGGPDGVENFNRLCVDRVVPDHPITSTPGGGEHHYFQQPLPKPLGNGTGRLPAGIDVRGAGGWVVAAGVMRPDGALWSPVEGKPTLLDLYQRDAVPQLPHWLVSLIRPTRPQGYGLPPVAPREDDEARAIAALRFINADDRETWWQVAAALQSHFGERGRAIWDAWSATSKKFDPATQETTWRSLGQRSGITLATLFHLARGRRHA